MLHELSITSLGVIESARLPLRSGLTVVTGETGAGKTMVLTGLGLILGGKASPDVVRLGASEASAEAVYDLPAGSDARALADDAGASIDDDGTVTAVRVVGAARSRAILGGRTVPQSLLAEVGTELVTVHGQAEQVRLRTPARQRQLLDSYAGQAHAAALAAYREAWATWRDAAERLARMVDADDAERARLARMRDDLAALTAVAVATGERGQLEAEAEVLSNAEALRAGAAVAHEALAGEGEFSAATALESARKALDDAGRHDATLAALAQRVAEHAYGAADIAQELASYVDRLEADPARLDAVHARLSAIGQAERRFARTADELEPLRAELEGMVGSGEDWDQLVGSARDAEAHARAELLDAAATVSAGRSSAADALAASVMEELGQLAMGDATVQIRVEHKEPGPHGADEVTMLLSAHPGAPARPVADAASGGELSRIMLALEVALAAGGEAAHTFVFDEVDAGVGGKAAQSVGARLAALASRHQVIVVTHLAQVAAWADAHIVVAKSSDGAVTVSQVSEVTGEDRVREIARLLSGEEDSVSARAHALELLEAARVAR